MRRVILLNVALVILVALIGCRESAEESTTEPSASPTAVEGEMGDETQVEMEGSGFLVGEDDKAGCWHRAPQRLRFRGCAQNGNHRELARREREGPGHGHFSLTLILSGETFYYGGLISDVKKAAKLEATVEVGSSEAAKYDLPQTINVRAVKNTREDTLSKSPRLGCVHFDESNEVVGGGFAYLGDDLASGWTAAFLVISGPLATPHSAVAQVEASIENEPSAE